MFSKQINESINHDQCRSVRKSILYRSFFVPTYQKSALEEEKDAINITNKNLQMDINDTKEEYDVY